MIHIIEVFAGIIIGVGLTALGLYIKTMLDARKLEKENDEKLEREFEIRGMIDPRAIDTVFSKWDGKIWRVTIGDSDNVSKGDEVLVIEALKMEIPIKAPADGKVKLYAFTGENVSQKDPLFSIIPNSEGEER